MTNEIEMEVICRTCLSETNSFKCIYKMGMLCGEITTLSAILTECTSLEFNEDEDLPRFICMRCVQQVCKSYIFRQNVFKANETIREQQSSIKNEEEILDTLFYYEQSAQNEDMEEDDVIENEEEVEVDLQHNVDVSSSAIDHHNDIKIELSSTETDSGTQYEVTVLKNVDQMMIERNEEVGDESSENCSNKEEEMIQEEQTNELIVEERIATQKCRSDRRFKITSMPEECELAESRAEITDEYSQGSVVTIAEKPQDITLEMTQENINTKRRSRKGHTFPAPSFRCEICGKLLSNNSSYKYHMQLHSDATPFLCSHCGEKFKTRNAYDGHMTTHDALNPNSCDICGKTYRQPSSLRIHILTHTGEKPYLCGICGKGLTQKSGFKKHMLTHTGEKPFKCDLCEKEFRYSSNLITHKRGHTGEKPFECKECDKRFTSGEQLKRHHLIHSGERPFSCDMCGKNFNRRSTLMVHKQIHNGKTAKTT